MGEEGWAGQLIREKVTEEEEEGEEEAGDRSQYSREGAAWSTCLPHSHQYLF